MWRNFSNYMMTSPGEGSCNPYANVVADEISAVVPLIDRSTLLTGLSRGRDGYSLRALQIIARRLQLEIWEKRAEIWPDRSDVSPMEAADPHVAIKALGFAVEEWSSLGQFQDVSGTVDVAGLFDADNRRIQISQRMPPHVARFTLAHELGHLVCGAPSGVHRDRAVDGAGGAARAPAEYEADKFAALFLMPLKQVVAEFHLRFLAAPFVVNEESAFASGFASSRAFRERFANKRDISLFLSTAKYFNGNQFRSMAECFRVSAVAMARRLEELGLNP
jgi:Zn-dependent peptidase ImmA (M78 family)